MRTIFSAAAFALVVGFTPALSRGASRPLISLTNTWRYYVGDTNLDGSGWEQPGYDDSRWTEGRGLFGFEDNPVIAPLINTALPDPRTFTPPGHAVYFRTRLAMPGGLHGATLYLRNHIDDGAVFYLNGQLVTRVRMNPGATNFLALASSLAREGALDHLVLDVTNLVAGENVLAVSVHQANSFSSDVVFGCAGVYSPIEPITIIEQPVSQSIPFNDPAVFSVRVTGSHPAYQWFWNRTRILGATQSNYSISYVRSNHLGAFQVVITNLLTSQTSSVATLTGLPDTTRPRLVSAIAVEGVPPYRMVVEYSEVVADNATNTGNYAVRRVVGSEITTNSLSVVSGLRQGNRVRLTISTNTPWRAGYNYVLDVRNVTDTAGNPIPAGSRIGIAFPPGRVVFPFNGVSRVWNTCAASAGGIQLPPDWKEADFDDSDPVLWPAGRGVLRCCDSCLPWPEDPPPPSSVGCRLLGDDMCAAVRCPLVASNGVFYFRSHFRADANAGPKLIALDFLPNYLLVFYLNGLEIYRSAGGIFVQDLTRQQPECLTVPWILAPNLRPGHNVLAVEVQEPPFGLGYLGAYGVQLRELVSAPLPPLPVVSITTAGVPCSVSWTSPCVVNLTWTPAGFPSCVLQVTTNLVTGPWMTVATNSPYVSEVRSEQTRFFRLSCDDAFR